jgi:hypothetical protein
VRVHDRRVITVLRRSSKRTEPKSPAGQKSLTKAFDQPCGLTRTRDSGSGLTIPIWHRKKGAGLHRPAP